MISITVILATYNRSQSLANALRSVADSNLPASIEWEVLVVDNNSTDNTPQLVKDFSSRYPGRFRYLFQPQPGKSHALNAGIRQAHGEILAFMDDDVVVDLSWLQNLTSPFLDSRCAGSGGRVLPEPSFSPPSWLSCDEPYALAPLAVFDLGTESRLLDEPPFGTNMAYRKSIFQRYGDFRTDLGPRPGNQIRNEDTEFGRRLLHAGEQLWYQPSAIVYHSVPQNRLRKQYFLDWWFSKSRADVREFGIPHDARWIVGGIPIYLFPRLGVWTVRWFVSIKPERRFSCKLNVWKVAGEILECSRQATHRSQR